MNNKKLNLAFLSKLREKKGLTQRDLSFLTGLSRDKISKIENNKITPSVIEILQFVEPLGYELKLSEVGFSFIKHEETIK